MDKGYKNYLSWDELATLVKEGAYIGNHSYSHTHLIDRLSGEDTTGWKNRIREDIQRAQEDIQKRLGVTPKLFSYPYGEFTTELQKLVSELGLFGITQKSGALDQDFDPLAVPRFPMAIPHDSLNRLIIAANARPLPVMLIDASPRMLSEEETATQRYEFSIHADGYRIDELACYNSGDGTRLETSKTYHNNEIRVSMQLPAWSAGVRKINCTAPSKREKNVFYWYSRLWIVYHSHKKPEQPE
ncbi:MAG: hypothetical protein D6698_13605 [Gammaproteobacteria bacterium]|nr:MAG: hypothetical protein D6698_13605 [Gammaproteobacteria bacterium]